jgi:hypothetical protein
MTDHDHLFKELIGTFLAEFLDLFLPEVRAYGFFVTSAGFTTNTVYRSTL